MKEKITKHTKHLRGEFKKHSSTAMIAALSFLIAISWKDLIVKLVQQNLKIEALETYPYLAELFTAVIVTMIAIIGIAIVSNWAQKEDKGSEKPKKSNKKPNKKSK